MKNSMVTVGIVIAILGGLGLAIESVSWDEQKTFVELGEFEASATVEESQTIPPLLAGGVLVLGLGVTAVGAMRSP